MRAYSPGRRPWGASTHFAVIVKHILKQTLKTKCFSFWKSWKTTTALGAPLNYSLHNKLEIQESKSCYMVLQNIHNSSLKKS